MKNRPKEYYVLAFSSGRFVETKTSAIWPKDGRNIFFIFTLKAFFNFFLAKKLFFCFVQLFWVREKVMEAFRRPDATELRLLLLFTLLLLTLSLLFTLLLLLMFLLIFLMMLLLLLTLFMFLMLLPLVQFLQFFTSLKASYYSRCLKLVLIKCWNISFRVTNVSCSMC